MFILFWQVPQGRRIVSFLTETAGKSALGGIGF